jgi:putative thiamine transport system permease protein
MSANVKKVALSAPMVLFFALPLIASLLFALSGVFDIQAWQSLFAHPLLWPALGLSIFTGLTSAALSLIFAVFVVAGLYQSAWWQRLSLQAGAMLAVPHVAVAIGLSFLIMPSGLLARVVAVFTSWTEPPNWITNHDPYGLSLIVALVLKETPFLMWILISILNRDDVRNNFVGQRAVGLSLGHGMKSIWLRIYLPQILPKLVWPLLVVFVYAATVVDMALVIGPTQPPTWAVVVWADINDAQVLNNARGAVGAWFLTIMIALAALCFWATTKMILLKREWLTGGARSRDLIRPVGAPSPEEKGGRKSSPSPLEKVPEGRLRSLATFSKVKVFTLMFFYSIIAMILVVLSFAPLWPFPKFWPETLSGTAWFRIWDNPSALITSLDLAFTTTAIALAIIITWMESQPQSRDKFITVLSATALGVPAILLALGQYCAFLQIGLTGSTFGLFFAHLLPVTAYMFIVLVGPYRSFDSRWRASASGLLASFPRFLWAIKLPLLKAPLLAASAIGFAVSFGQYVPAQLIAAGRYSTLPMEAVTLTTGTNRPLTAAFTLLLMAPPLLAFIAASYFGKSRWRPA